MSADLNEPSLRDIVRAKLLAPRPVRASFKAATRAWRVVRHLIAFRAPDERLTCPVCAAANPVPLVPIPLEGRSRTYGFASGCTRCGVVFANPFPSREQATAAYSPEGVWGRHRQQEQEKQVSRQRLERLFAPLEDRLNVLVPPPSARVLDFGCGLGGMLDGLAVLGWDTYGIEPAMKVAFDRHQELTDVPASATFDLAILHNVLEHVTDPLAILRQMSGAVREGGLLLISVPNLDGLAVHRELKYCIRAGVHVLAYTRSCLTWLAADAGFDIVSDRSEVSSRQRHLILIAQRRSQPIAKPSTPLDAARQALGRFTASHGAGQIAGWLPVRVRAAMLDLQRTDWRV